MVGWGEGAKRNWRWEGSGELGNLGGGAFCCNAMTGHDII